MPGVLEEEFNDLVDALNKSEYTKEESILILKEYTNTLFTNSVPGISRPGASMITADFIKRVRNYHWKFAHGFYGNWAKHAIEQDQDVGC
jgi:hypothetical protein